MCVYTVIIAEFYKTWEVSLWDFYLPLSFQLHKAIYHCKNHFYNHQIEIKALCKTTVSIKPQIQLY